MGAYVHLEIVTILKIHLIKKKIYIYEIWGLNPTYTKNQLVYWPNEKKKKKTNHLRAFASGFFKLFYFTISKPILSFIPYHFTLLSPS